jgi:hypothetical protein
MTGVYDRQTSGEDVEWSHRKSHGGLRALKNRRLEPPDDSFGASERVDAGRRERGPAPVRLAFFAPSRP